MVYCVMILFEFLCCYYSYLIVILSEVKDVRGEIEFFGIGEGLYCVVD